MSRAALLIDWENFTGRLADSPWWVTDVAPLIKTLVEKIDERATELGAPLEQKS